VAGAAALLGAELVTGAAAFWSVEAGARLAAAGSGAWSCVLAWLVLAAVWSWLLGHPVRQSTAPRAIRGNVPNLGRKLISHSS
jgi:hypothetical protein